MRCYFVHSGHFAAVEDLELFNSDADAIEQAGALFIAARHGRFEGFEVWDLARRVYRFPEVTPD
jgi:hypothetical protein